MTDRTELERLLAAATEGPFSGIYKNYAVQGNMRAIVNGDRYPIAFVPAWDAPEDGEVEASAEGEANANLICFLRNNAQHYLSLMDEVGRLRGKNEVLREVLADLVSWFPKKPSEPEWRLSAGPHGADDAINAARQALAARGYKIERIDND